MSFREDFDETWVQILQYIFKYPKCKHVVVQRQTDCKVNISMVPYIISDIDVDSCSNDLLVNPDVCHTMRGHLRSLCVIRGNL